MASKPRICLLTTSFPRFADDEASVFVQRLVEGYSDNGAAGLVLVPQDADEAPTSRCAAFEVQRFRYGIFCKGALAFGAGIMPNIRRRPLLILQAPILLLQFVRVAWSKRKGYDVIHANWALALLAAWLLRLVAKKPFVVTVRGEDLKLLRAPLLRWIFRPALRQAGAIVSVNRTFMSELSELHLGAVPCVLIPNGVSQFSSSTAQSEEFLRTRPFAGRNFLLFVGTVVPRKRIHKLFMLLTLERFKQHALVICGRLDDETYVKQLKEEAAEKGVAARVFYEGAVPPSTIGYYLAGATLYVSASEFEGRPNAVLEAMAAGVPCVVSDIPAHREIVVDGESGLLATFDDATELKAQFSRYSPEAIKAMSEQAKRALNNLSWKGCASAYINVFNELVAADKQA